MNTTIRNMDRAFATPTDLYDFLVNALAEFLETNGFDKVLVGVSGGMDSAMVATLAADAIGGENVYGVAMPSDYSTSHSLEDAEELMKNIGGHYRVVPIKPMYDAFQESLALTGLAEQNIQARIRGMILMSISNMEGQAVLATGNRSEALMGYCTMYGDTVGAFAPIVGVFKTDIYKLAAARNAEGLMIPEHTIAKAPSAELAPGQVDSNDLPAYDVLDPILRNMLFGDPLEAAAAPELLDALKARIAKNAWKAKQCPAGPA